MFPGAGDAGVDEFAADDTGFGGWQGEGDVAAFGALAAVAGEGPGGLPFGELVEGETGQFAAGSEEPGVERVAGVAVRESLIYSPNLP